MEIKTNAKVVARNFQQYAKNVQDNGDEIVREIIADITESLTVDPKANGGTGTPRDTRRTTNNWNVSNGRGPDFSDIGEGQHGEPSGRYEAYAKVPKGSMEANVANATPYLNSLDQGSSRQAPKGFIRRAIRRAVQDLERVSLLRPGSVRKS